MNNQISKRGADTSGKEFSSKAEELWEIIKAERPEKERKRVIVLQDIYLKHFLTLLPENIQNNLVLSIPLLQTTVNSYFDSIYRYKLYSKTDYADRHKCAAYMMKWIAKYRPIQIRGRSSVIEDIPKGVSWVNSYYAVYVALTHLFATNSTTNDPNDILKKCDQNLYNDLVYQAQYRNISGRSMAAQLCSIEMLCQAREQISSFLHEKNPLNREGLAKA